MKTNLWTRAAVDPLLLLSASLFFSMEARATEISATVKSFAAGYATVTTNDNAMPRPGDNAEIYFQMPGTDVDISVAKGHVYEITGRNIMIQVDNATGSVAAGQKVRIMSEHPINPGSNTATSPTETPPPVQAATPQTQPTEMPPPPQTTPPIQYPSAAPPRPIPFAPPRSTTRAPTPKPAPPRRIVGTWMGPKHQVQFLANGTVILAPDLPSETKRGVWRLDGDRLVYQMSDGKVKIFRIASYSTNEMVLVDQQGGLRRHTRIGR